MTRSLLATLVLGTAVSLFAAQPAEAQFGKLRDRVKRKAEERVDRKTDEAAEKIVDSADPTDDAANGSQNAGAATASGSDEAPKAGAPDAKPGEGVWANYDFVPGERVLYLSDFSKDNVGDFPRRLEFGEGNMEVVEWNGERWLRATTESRFDIPLPEVLPERFTLEFEHVGLSYSHPHVIVKFDGTDQYTRDHNTVQFVAWTGGAKGSTAGVLDRHGNRVSFGMGENYENKPVTVRVMADGKYVKVYLNSIRVANVPNADLGRANKITIEVEASSEMPAFFRNIRIAAGGKDLYDALAQEGRVATQGIYFDTGSDRLRPESSPTLKEIGEMLKEHADLRLAIEGHTDNVGQPAANQALSEKRAASVRQYLIENFGIDAARLEAKGYGDTKPVGSNDTPEGRQSNRRVELVKL